MWSDVASIYRSSKKRVDINWFTEWICRPPAAVLVYLLRNTRVTPNQVTFLSGAVAGGAAAMIALLPGHLWLIAAVVVFEFSFVLDCADGQLARLRKIASPLGHLLDFLMDELKALVILGCVAIRLWQQSGDDAYLLVGIGGLVTLGAGLMMTTFVRRPEYGAAPPTEDGQPAQLGRRTGVLALPINAMEYAARTIVQYPSHIWLWATIDRMDIFLWLYAGVNALYSARMMLVLLIRLGRFAPGAEASK